MSGREKLKDKKRIVVKIGSSSLTHTETGRLNLRKIEKLVRILCELGNEGRDVVLVSSGAIAVGSQVTGVSKAGASTSQKQALAAVGQARLMMTYQRIFAEYNHTTAQILMTKDTIVNGISCYNTLNTFEELFKMGIIPVVNENDTVATHEIVFGDNDRLSAIVAAMLHADLLILLSDIDGLYTDDPNTNPDAQFIEQVPRIDEKYLEMGKESSGSVVGTGGMAAKLAAAQIATDAGADMIIANGEDVGVLYQIMDGQPVGTLFLAHQNQNFNLYEYIAKY
jgi:glutamate 5-kinase